MINISITNTSVRVELMSKFRPELNDPNILAWLLIVGKFRPELNDPNILAWLLIVGFKNSQVRELENTGSPSIALFRK